ncbi:MAG: PIG-L family deacetylase, partial [Planctomycetes bacterium]|nr:PIG-L family deacetylase [Planctomycetota bacterium]
LAFVATMRLPAPRPARAVATSALRKRLSRVVRTWLVLVFVAALAPGQRWQDTCGRTEAGMLAMRQAARDAAADSLVLLVASHPDDRYILPAVWLRSQFGLRVATLLATRGGGGQNTLGPETGDAFERIRTLETEAGCALAGTEAWYLNCPDGGYRRSAEETFAEWGRERTLRELVRLLRKIRPDAVMTTHHREEGHGHDLAVVELLPEAVAAAGDPGFDAPGEPHQIPVFLMGAGSTVSPKALLIDADHLDRDRGKALRRIAYDILRGTHVSPGPPNHIDDVFGPVLKFEPLLPERVSVTGDRPLGLPSVLDPDRWPGEPAQAERFAGFVRDRLPQLLDARDPPIAEVLASLRDLRTLRAGDGISLDVAIRLQRRIDALERLALTLARVQIEVEAPPGTVAIAGEEFSCPVRVLTGRGTTPTFRAEGLDGVGVELTPLGASEAPASSVFAEATVRIPLGPRNSEDPMQPRFEGDRFVPPVRIRFWVKLDDLEVPVVVTVPVEQHAPVELSVVPRMLLLPSARNAVQFSVGVKRNSQFPVEGQLEVRAPAGYAIDDDRHPVSLREQRSDSFGFVVEAPRDRRTGVDVLRIRLGGTKVALPVHKVDVEVPDRLRVGVLRSLDDTLPSVLGVGGLGIDWSELIDADIAAADLSAFDTIVVDIRALRGRPEARYGFGRLLDFARGAGHRLVLFYQKDVEFHPSGERFRGAPFEPFEVGRSRVTRPDAPVEVLLPDHVLMRHPNRIRPSDWDGWVQERALYLTEVYADQFEEVLEIGDPGQPRERGALLYTRTGDGEYVYCSLALWRQLKKLHPGAVRMLVNLLTPAPKN